MSEPIFYSRLVSVSPRFTRSVSLTRDFDRPDALDGYILTPVARGVLGRLAAALGGESTTRAWSLTGPYGSGKSAFGLFVAQLLGGEDKARLGARSFLQNETPDVCQTLFAPGTPLAKKASRLCTILVSGSRQPLEKALAATLAGTLRRLSPRGRPLGIVERLEGIVASTKPTGVQVVELYEQANEYLEKFGTEAEGLLLIIDELGKFLEYGASHPDQGDVFVLQELAEAATRATKRPFLFLTILHQAIDRYADLMSPSRRSEWAKVQGRFEDVAFEERAEQVIRLVSHAVRHSDGEPAAKALRRQAEGLAEETVSLGVRAGSLGRSELKEYLANSHPLHPLTTLAVGPLFRQFAQNERSLFAFLSSGEPAGFQEFLSNTACSAKERHTYRLDHLYDYVVGTFGPTLLAQPRSRVWVEVQSALERLRDATDLEVRVAKAIGLLQAAGPSSPVPASVSVLKLALGEVASGAEVEAAVGSLVRRSLIVFRRHLGSYALWEGSDIDIESRLDDARRAVNRDQPVAAFLTQLVPPQPLVARRHYFQKGTLRYFDVRYADRATLESELARDLGEADGRVVLCIPANAEEREAMRAALLSPLLDAPDGTVGVVPKSVFDIRELCYELQCLRWVLQHTPELQTDRGARKELHHRISHVEQAVRRHIEWVFNPRPGRETECAWCYTGAERTFTGSRALNNFLSSVCDEVYPATPVWRNELINRRALSSSAAAARRDLIAAMIDHAGEEGLGMTGVPPERSMYETLLRSPRMHRKKGGEWGFHPPDAKEDPALAEVWKAITRFLAETEPARLPVVRLFQVLRRPPFGLKDGVLPVLLAAALLHFDTEVALYEDGTFVPRLNDAIFERIFRTPERFDLQRFRVAGPRAEVFQQYAALLNRPAGQGEGLDLLALVKPLVRVVRELPEYVSKTKQLSPSAQAVLRAIREARQPDRLLFTDLPAACGFEAFGATGKLDPVKASAYFESLRVSLAELQRAYPQLVAAVERLILDAFGHPGELAAARRALDHEARLVANLAVDPKLKALLGRLADSGCDAQVWVESIATLLAGRPPVAWDDQDRARFEVSLTAAARTFRHFRVIAFEMERAGTPLLDGDPHMLRVSITVPNEGEVERVVTLPPDRLADVQRAKDLLRQALVDANLLRSKDAGVAVLAQLTRQLLSEDRESGRPG